MRKDHEPLSLSVAYVHTIPDGQRKIAGFNSSSAVWPNIREKSRQKFVKISVPSHSTLLSFCQIFMTITNLQAAKTHSIVLTVVFIRTDVPSSQYRGYRELGEGE